MLAQGTPLHVVSEVLGHASIAVTKDVYGHLVEGDKRAAAEAMMRSALQCRSTAPWLPAWLPGQEQRPLSGCRRTCELARSEGLEPPTF